MADEMKTCPFCARDVWVGTVIAGCPDCGTEFTHEYWNTRPIEDALRAEFKELTTERNLLSDTCVDLRAEVAKLKADIKAISWHRDAEELENNKLRIEVARLQAELAKYTTPLNNRQREAISRAMRVQNNPNMTKWDAAIRAAREVGK